MPASCTMLPGSRAPALAHASPVARAAARRLALRVRAVVDTRIAAPFRRDAEHLAQWSPKSWKNNTAHQQPNYPDAAKLQDAVDMVARMPPLVFAGECRNLQARLAKCAAGEAFLLQGALRSRGTCHYASSKASERCHSAELRPLCVVQGLTVVGTSCASLLWPLGI